MSISLKQIAEKLGCSLSTVSRAMKGNPRISASMRDKVQSLARELGYCPDPMVSTLMSHLKRIRQVSHKGTLGWIYHHGWKNPEHAEFCQHSFTIACQRAEELGYVLEPFWLRSPNSKIPEGSPSHWVTVTQLKRILKTRNIRGLILAPWVTTRTFWPLPWSELAVVATDYTPYQPAIHRVVPDMSFNLKLCLKKIKEFGYQKLGYVFPEFSNYFSSMVADFFSRERSFQFYQLRLPDYGNNGKSIFQGFIRRHSLDAIVCLGPKIKVWLEEMGIAIPEELGLWALDTTADPSMQHWTGLNLHWDHLAESAVEMVATELQNNKLGLPSYQKSVMIRGQWVPGNTTRRMTVRTQNHEFQKCIAVLTHYALYREIHRFWRTLAYELEELSNKKIPGSQGGFNLIFYDSLQPPSAGSSQSQKNLHRLEEDLQFHDFKGVIYLGLNPASPFLPKDLSMLPQVVYSGYGEEGDVLHDKSHFLRTSHQFLVKRGCQRVVYLRGFKLSEAEEKAIADISNTNNVGLEVENVLSGSFPKTRKAHENPEIYWRDRLATSFSQVIDRWKREKYPPQGLIVWEDVAMQAISKALSESHWKPPENFQMVSEGYGGTGPDFTLPVTHYFWPRNHASVELLRILQCRIGDLPVGKLPLKIAGSLRI